MRIFTTADGLHYRRWVNILPTLLLPGLGHYLAGQTEASLVWVLTHFSLAAVYFYLAFFAPFATESLIVRFGWVQLAFGVVAATAACRRPIPCMKVMRWIVAIAAAVAIQVVPLMFIRQWIAQPFFVPTGGMAPTVAVGDRILVDKRAYWFHEPERGDIVAFSTAEIPEFGIAKNQTFIKRVVGLPGERVSLDPPFLRINGVRLQLPLFSGANRPGVGQGYVFGGILASVTNEIILKEDQYLVFGDNGVNSLDGRYFGPIERDGIFGKVVWIYRPIERRGRLEQVCH